MSSVLPSVVPSAPLVRRRALALVAGAIVSAAAAGTVSAQAQPAKPAAAPAHGGHGGHGGHGAQGEGHGAGESHHALPWKRLDGYHTVMAASWHPAKDRNDLAPFRARATDLLAAAKALAAEPVPAACGGPARAPQVQALLAATAEAAKLAATPGVADEPLKAALRTAHDRFHAVEEGCEAKKD